MPEARSTPPNMPPAPVMRMTEATGPSAESTTFSSAVPLLAAPGAEHPDGHEHGDEQRDRRRSR